MNLTVKSESENLGWDMKLWLWVLLCSILIYLTIPLARVLQKYVYASVGKEFFTYAVLFVIIGGLTALLYVLIYKFKVRSVSQYVWLCVCGSIYVFLAIRLRQHPEEAVHLLEYGLLSYLVFKALSHRVRDWTVYISAAGLTALIGTGDEFIQWLVPTRVWDYRDVGINAVAGVFFMVAIWKGVKPEIITQPVKKYSVKVLAGIVTLDLIFLGFCLSITPGTLQILVAKNNGLSWLQHEEKMTEYGYLHRDKEIGAIYSRLMLEDLKMIDNQYGEAYGILVNQYQHSKKNIKELKKIYTPNINPFLYEFLVHVIQRNGEFEGVQKTESIRIKSVKHNIAYRENLIVEKYFKTTLEYSGLKWPDNRSESIQKSALLWEDEYISTTGKFITMFSMRTAWILIASMVIIIWISVWLCRRRLSDD